MRLMVARKSGAKKGLILLVLVLLAFGGSNLHAQELSGVPKAAVDGQTLDLTDDRRLRLESIQTPAMQPNNPRFRPWPLAEEARRALEGLAGRFALTIRPAKQPLDRYGRLIAQVKRPDGVWLQGEMVKLGLARVETTKANHAQARELYALEAEARDKRIGIWALEFYAVREPEDLDGLIGTFQIVEGVIAQSSRIKGRIFLNFGPNWRTDFTVTIAPRDRQAMEKRGMDPLSWKGKRVRVRGWLGSRNGPTIALDHIEQIEFLP